MIKQQKIVNSKKAAAISPMRRIPTDAQKISQTHKQFSIALRTLSREQRTAIINQMRDDAINLSILEKAEFDPSPIPTEEQYQQQFFDQTGWFYPDEDYRFYKIKDRR